MDHYVGLYVSLRSVAVCVIDANGKHVFERSLACGIEDVVTCLRDVPVGRCQVGFESGTMSPHLYFGLRAAGLDVVCMEARQMNSALSAMRNKTDKTDARRIAQALRSGWFSEVIVKSREAHAYMALLSRRKAVQKKCIDLSNEAPGLYWIFGLRLPSPVDHGSFD